MKYFTAGLLFVPSVRSFTNTKVIVTLTRQPPLSALHLYQIHDDMDTPKFDGPITSTAEASTSSYMASNLLPPPVSSSIHRNFVSTTSCDISTNKHISVYHFCAGELGSQFNKTLV